MKVHTLWERVYVLFMERELLLAFYQQPVNGDWMTKFNFLQCLSI